MNIVADIGGTKTVMALAAAEGGDISLSSVHRFKNEDYSSFESVFGAYCNAVLAERIHGAGIAVAGRVTDDRCEMTNLSWMVDGKEIRRKFDIGKVMLHNDLAASGYGLDVVSREAIKEIHPGRKNEEANRALISPGTGLGECIVHAIDNRHIPMATEGGHTDFAPFNGATSRLWTFIRSRQSRVSVEDVLSGPGINNIYRFVVSENGDTVDPEIEKKISASPGVVVANKAVEEGDVTSMQAIGLFFDVLAAECGNMALKALATGGVYIGGGIVPYVLPLMDGPRFAQIFADKGPHKNMLADIPIHAVTDTDLPLYGAAHHLLNLDCA